MALPSMPRIPRPFTRVLVMLMSITLLVGLAGIGGSAAVGTGTRPTKQSLAQHILNTAAGKLMTASARAALEMFASGDRHVAPDPKGNDFSKAKKGAGGLAAPTPSFTNARVNNPATDTNQTDQTTQSETAIGVAGSHVVAGFNDSQHGLLFLTAGANLNGYGYSDDGGATWVDGGTIPNAPALQNVGDPWIATDRAGNFYYSSLAIDVVNGLDIGIAKSTDGGHTFSQPVIALPQGNLFDFGDKDAMTTGPDPTVKTRDNVYVAWDDFGCDQTTCFNGLPVARSTDGGASYQVTYADKFNFDTTGCSFQQYIGAMPLVDKNGVLYLTAERFSVTDPDCTGGLFSMDQSFFKSTDGGQTFSSRTTIASVVPATPFGALILGPGQYMRTIEFPTMAILGNALYVAWNDGTSGNSHIRLAKSTNGGASWSLSWTTQGTNDEVQPALSADTALHLFYYRRNNNNTLDVFVANSANGNSFVANRVSTVSSPGVITLPNFDPIIAWGYMGDYLANASDGSHQYFAWGDNRDIVTNFLWPQGRHDPDVFFAKQ